MAVLKKIWCIYTSRDSESEYQTCIYSVISGVVLLAGQNLQATQRVNTFSNIRYYY